MTKFHLIYRPLTKEYLQYFDFESKYGPHLVRSNFSKVYPFESRREASEIAGTIKRADKIRIQIITFSESGRNTIDWRETQKKRYEYTKGIDNWYIIDNYTGKRLDLWLKHRKMPSSLPID